MLGNNSMYVSFKCTKCSATFTDEINGIVLCPECGSVLPLPPTLTDDQKEKIYNEALIVSNRARRSENLQDIVSIFEQLGDYEDSAHQAERCRKMLNDAKKDEKFALAIHKMELETIRGYREAIALFEELEEWKGASFKLEECKAKLQTLLEKREKHKDIAVKITMIGCAVLIALTLIIWAVIQFLVPAIRYAWALDKIEDGEFDKGYATLEDLGDYKEAKTELKKSKYNRALLYETEGNLILACDFYDQAVGYSDAHTRLYNVCTKLTLKEQLSVLDIGSTVVFGRYDQDPATEGNEPLEWIIVDKKGDEALIVSKNAIEGTPFSTTPTVWSGSELCNWLNSYFYKNYFTSSERVSIVQKLISTRYIDQATGENKVDLANNYLFLLSDVEAESYFKTKDDRCAPATKSIIQKNVTFENRLPINDGNGCAHYWLRTIALDGSVMYVNGSGGVNRDGKAGENIMGVRPAMWVKG